MNWTINQTVDLSRGYTPVVWPDALMVSGDVGAHTWRVAVLDNGNPVDLSGATITGSFLRADGNTVLVSGSISRNIASVTLTDVCYAVEGKMKGTIKMTKSGTVITLAAVIFTVSLFTSGSVIDPGVAYADFQIDASPAGTYADLAALIAADPDHSKIYITRDDGNWCYHNGTTWVAGGVYMASDDFVALRTDFDALVGGQIPMKYAWVSGRIDGNTGDFLADNRYWRTEMGAIEQGSILSIVVPAGYVLRIAEYSEMGAFVGLRGGHYITGVASVTIGSPKIALMYGKDPADVFPVSDTENLDIRLVNWRTIPVEEQIKSLIPYTVGKNRLDRSASVPGYLLAAGTVYEVGGFETSDYIPVTSGQPVTITPRLRKFIAYDSNKVAIAGTFLDADTPNYTYTPTVDGYIRVSYATPDPGTMVEYSATATEYEPYSLIPDSRTALSTRMVEQVQSMSLSGKIGMSFGDSIMQGGGAGYVGILSWMAQVYGTVAYEHAVGGATMQYIEAGRSCIPEQIQSESDGVTPDFILLNGLSNDVGLASSGTLGTLTDSFDYQTAGYTASFVAGMEHAIGQLRDKYPGAPIIYVIPHSTPARDYATELQYGDMARQICKKWGVAVVDMYREGGLNTRIAAQKSLYCESTDSGTHPNELGYKTFYLPMIAAKLREVLS